jgi:hypothetical protein
VDHLHQCQIICWYLPLETPSFLFTDSDTSPCVEECPLHLFPQPPVECIYMGCTSPTLIMISKPVKILCASYEFSQKLSEKPLSGGAYPRGPGPSAN